MSTVGPREVDGVGARRQLAVMAQIKADTASIETGPVGSSIFAGMKVLVVDDDFRNIFAMTALLERGHAEVVAADSGLAAIAVLQDDPEIDIVLMDIMMPFMDGYATIRAIRSIDRFKSLPIIAVTAKVLLGERERCIDAGADDYVTKPVDVVAFFTKLSLWSRILRPKERRSGSR